jgi:3-oxoacyl-[acyl-carrier protein] reductase
LARFVDKVVVITGASRGIGRAIAERFGAEGARVAVNHFDDADEANSVIDGIRSAGGVATGFAGDVSDPGSVNRMIEAVRAEFGEIDVLINNAGVSSHVPFVDLSVEEWDRVLAVNLRGVFLAARAVVPHMLDRGTGQVINIASELGLVGAPRVVHYCASKGGVLAMTKALARELAPTIRVNAIAPGPIETELLTAYPDEYNDDTLSQIPLGRWGQPADIAGTAAFLASEDASYYTGWVLSPNGGVVM